jgi:predicted Zn-dependent protease
MTGSTKRFTKRLTRRLTPGWPLLCLAVLSWPVSTFVHAQDEALPPPPAPAITSTLPALGDTVSQSLSPRAERRLGDRIMRSIRRDPDVIDDPLVLEYVDQLWQSLLSAARQRGEIGPELEASHAWAAFLVRDRSVNAFALPGGYIGVHLGLLAMTTTPGELASVLAHELSHVTQRHIARMIGQQSRQSWVSLASLLLGVLAASRAPAAAQAMIYGGQAAAIQGQLNFSRDMEREADRIGFAVLSDAGFEPSGMALMFEHLQQASRLNDDGSYPYLRTHPLTSERIGEARSRMGPEGWRNATNAGQKDGAIWAQHMLMAARARVLMDTRSVALTNLLNPEVRRGTEPLQAVTAYYRAGLASQRTGESGKAMGYFNQARSAVSALPAVQQAIALRTLTLAQAELLLNNRQVNESEQMLDREMAGGKAGLLMTARPELMLRAQIVMALPDGPNRRTEWEEAAARLQTHVSNAPEDAAAWAALGELWQRLKQPLRAVRAEAEAAAALGDLPGAIDRIQATQRRFKQPSAADVIELSVMDSRLKAWQRQHREDLREEGG